MKMTIHTPQKKVSYFGFELYVSADTKYLACDYHENEVHVFGFTAGDIEEIEDGFKCCNLSEKYYVCSFNCDGVLDLSKTVMYIGDI